MHFQVLLIVLLFLIYTKPLQAQNNSTVDSLEELAINSNSPNEKAALYHSIAKQYLGVDFEKAEQYEHLTLKFCTKDNYSKLGDCYGVFTAIYAQTDRNQEAFLAVDSSIYYYELAKDYEGLVYAYGNKGGLYLQLEDYENGAKVLYKSLEINKRIGNIEASLGTLQNILELYRILGEYDKMFVACEEILLLADSTNNNKMKAFAYHAMGAATYNSSKLDSSLTYYKKAAIEFNAIKNNEYLSICYVHIALIYALKDKHTLALKFLKKAQNIETYINSTINYIEFNLSVAHIYYRNRNYQKSILTTQTVLDSAYSIHNLYYQGEALERLMQNMLKLKNFEAVYDYQSQRIKVLDSLYRYNQQAEILNLKTKYETEKIEQQNAFLAKEKEIEKLRANRNQQLLYLSILAIALILFISILLMRQYKTNAAHLTNQLKHRLLRNQMSPHFIFNSLVAIQNYVYKNTPIKAGEYLASFAQLIRAILENSMEEYIPLEKEIQWLDNYLQLQLLRFDHSFDYTIDLDKNIDLENMLIPPMLTQPFIENALEHGLRDLDYRGEINIKMSLKDDILYIDVSDNGIGLDASNAHKDEKKHKSLALKITQERLHFLNKKRGKNIFFNMKNLDSKGTLISFSLPLNYKY